MSTNSFALDSLLNGNIERFVIAKLLGKHDELSHGNTRATVTGPRAKSLTNLLYLKTPLVEEALRKPKDL